MVDIKTGRIRVMVVEDSAVSRELLVSIFQSSPDLQVIGTARNGMEAVRLAKRLKPDVITMDVYMPEMDGLEATRQIMSEIPCPVVIISASLNKSQQELTFNALQAGALSVLEKPAMNDLAETHEALVYQVKLMSEVKVMRRKSAPIMPRLAVPHQSQSLFLTGQPMLSRNEQSGIQVVAIASSTGGPGVLAEILSKLPADFPAPILVVQHITPGFSEGLVNWLDKQTPLEVSLAGQAVRPKPGQVLVAPDHAHMLINRMGLISLRQTPAVNGLRPSADYLFGSIAEIYGDTAIGVILTGMGNDGAAGLRAMRDMGSHTIAQDRDSCVVFGMPAVAIELGAVEQILPPAKISQALLTLSSAV